MTACFKSILMNQNIKYEKTSLPPLSLVRIGRDSVPPLSDVSACSYPQMSAFKSHMQQNA